MPSSFDPSANEQAIIDQEVWLSQTRWLRHRCELTCEAAQVSRWFASVEGGYSKYLCREAAAIRAGRGLPTGRAALI